MTAALFGDDAVQRSAVISPDGLYRYRLDRWWGDGERLVFVMLNPSIADASVDDPTIRRCMGFARRDGYDGLTVINLFGLRATNPVALMESVAPIGPDNPAHIDEVVRGAGSVVAAWGAHKVAHHQGRRHTRQWERAGILVRCLGTTQGGAPRHPLYIRGDQPLVPFGVLS